MDDRAAGAVAGRIIIKLGGKLPVKLSLGAYYNVVTPQYAARWQCNRWSQSSFDLNVLSWRQASVPLFEGRSA